MFQENEKNKKISSKTKDASENNNNTLPKLSFWSNRAASKKSDAISKLLVHSYNPLEKWVPVKWTYYRIAPADFFNKKQEESENKFNKEKKNFIAFRPSIWDICRLSDEKFDIYDPASRKFEKHRVWCKYSVDAKGITQKWEFYTFEESDGRSKVVADNGCFCYEKPGMKFEFKVVSDSPDHFSYEFDDNTTLTEVIDGYINIIADNNEEIKKAAISKLSRYEQAQLFRMASFVYKSMMGVIEAFKNKDDLEFDELVLKKMKSNDIFLDYIAKGKFENIVNILKSIKDISQNHSPDSLEASTKYDYELSKIQDNISLTDEEKTIVEKIALFYNDKKANDSEFKKAEKERYMQPELWNKSDVKYLKKMLADVPIPQYNNKKNKLIFDKEVAIKLRNYENFYAINVYIHRNDSNFMKQFTPEERVKMIRYFSIGPDSLAKPNTISQSTKTDYNLKFNPPAITFNYDYKDLDNMTYIRPEVIKNSDDNFTLQDIGKDTKENDKPGDAPVFEAHTASGGTGAKTEVTHCFIRFRATEYNPDDNPSDPYKRKVYSLGFYPGAYRRDNYNTRVAEHSFVRKLVNKLAHANTFRGLLIDDSTHYSQMAITRKCDNNRILKLSKSINSFASTENYNLSCNNCTTFVSKMSKGIGFSDIARLFKDGLLYAPNLAARKLVDAMMSKKYIKDNVTNYKTEDFAYKQEKETLSKEITDRHGKAYFSKKTHYPVLYEMIHNDRNYMDANTYTEKLTGWHLGKVVYEQFEKSYENYVKYFYKLDTDNDIDTSKNKERELQNSYEAARLSFEGLAELSDDEKKKDPYNYKRLLQLTNRNMIALREICRRHGNIPGFLLANSITERTDIELKKIAEKAK